MELAGMLSFASSPIQVFQFDPTVVCCCYPHSPSADFAVQVSNPSFFPSLHRLQFYQFSFSLQSPSDCHVLLADVLCTLSKLPDCAGLRVGHDDTLAGGVSVHTNELFSGRALLEDWRYPTKTIAEIESELKRTNRQIARSASADSIGHETDD